MKTKHKMDVSQGARSEGSTGERNADGFVREPIPPVKGTHDEHLNTSKEVARALNIAAMRSNRTPHRIAAVLGALVVMCIVMAAVVWWRLLT